MTGHDGVLAVLGATGWTGREVVGAALARGWRVRALVRTPGTLPAGVTEVVGDARDGGWADPLLRGADAAICVIGPRPGEPADTCSIATRTLLGAAERHGVRRVVVVTGAMAGHPAEDLSWLYRLLRRALPAEQRAELADRRVQERLVQASPLEWTLVRPPRLTSGRPTGAVAWGAHRFVGALSRVDRTDLAAFLLDALDVPWLRRAAITVACVPRHADTRSAVLHGHPSFQVFPYTGVVFDVAL